METFTKESGRTIVYLVSTNLAQELGKGTMKYSDEGVYKGEWEKDMREGKQKRSLNSRKGNHGVST